MVEFWKVDFKGDLENGVGLFWKKFGRFGREKVDFKGNGVILHKSGRF